MMNINLMYKHCVYFTYIYDGVLVWNWVIKWQEVGIHGGCYFEDEHMRVHEPFVRCVCVCVCGVYFSIFYCLVSHFPNGNGETIMIRWLENLQLESIILRDESKLLL